MTAARWRLVRDMHRTLCAEADIIDRREEFRVWYMQNCNGSLYHAMLGDNPSEEEGYVEAHSIYRWLPGGQNEQFEQLKQRGGSVPLFVCLQTAHGRLELLPGGSGSKGFRFAGMRSVASVQIHSTPKMVGGEARQATVTLSAPTAGGTCPLQVAGIPRAIQVVGAPVTPEDDDEPEFIETRGPKKRARQSSTLRDKRDEEQAKVLKRVKKENRAAEKARDDAEKKKSAAEGKLEDAQELANQLVLSENNKMSEIDELRRTVSERDSRIEALEAEAREKDATIAELRGRMGQLDDALAAVDALRNRPRV